MISGKNLIQLSVLLLLSAPLFAMPTNAQTINPTTSTVPCGNIGNECPLSISPSVVQGTPGSTVTVNVVVNDTMWLGNWLIRVHYDFSVLSATKVHVLDGNNIWDGQVPTPPPWTSGGCSTGNSYDQHANLLQATMPTACLPITSFDANGAGGALAPGCTITASHFSGCVAEGQTLLGGLVNVTGTTGLTLFSIDFAILNGGSSSVLLTSDFQLLSGADFAPPFNGGFNDTERIDFAHPHDGQAFGIGSAALIKSKVDVAIHHLKLSQGNVQTLSGTIGNTGTVPVNVRVDFVIVSEAGDVFFMSTGVLLLPVNTSGVLSVSYTVPSLPLRYHVIGILTLSADGVNFVRGGSTATTAYSVVL